ncbi:MAG: hypothetical protein H7Y07_01640 [Pyrinomonadaceae bacterium]|nr:hypothetical protein [Sphingobacteriaceae bacterium]
MRNSAGSGGATETQVKDLIVNLNRVFSLNSTGIQFYLKCGTQYIDDDKYIDVGESQQRQLARTYEDPHAIDVFLTDNILDAAGSTVYSSDYITFDSFRASMLDKSSYIKTSADLAHEIGHYLGLLHTHEFSERKRCRKEPIDRNREYADISYCKPFGSKIMCESTGDGLRDTPADPDMTELNRCDYPNNGKTDLFGDSYHNPPAGSSPPSTANIMAKNKLSNCAHEFTRLQKAVMFNTIESHTSNTLLADEIHKDLWKDSKYIFDTFEPDNTSDNSSTITLGERQERNFNYQPSFTGQATSCDVDYIRYFSVKAGLTEIKISQISGKSPASTILYLLGVNGNVLAQSESTTNTFSKITFNLNAGVAYTIKVVNQNPADNGFYALTVGCDLSAVSIQGSRDLCGPSGNFSIDPQLLPPNANVTWSINGGMSIAGSNTGSSVTVNSNGNYQGTLEAVITSSCSGTRTITMDIFQWSSHCNLIMRTGNFSYSPNPADDELTVSYILLV